MFVVAGVTGNTGSVVAETLLAKGKSVRVLVREAEKGAAWRAKGAEVAVATLDDADALARALDGAEGAYLLLPPATQAPDVLAVRRRTVDAIAAAVERSGVRHVVFLSSVGAQHDAGTGLILTVNYGEARLAKTPAKLTFVRAAYFLENWAHVVAAAKAGTLPTFLVSDQPIPMVATRDIALVAAHALLEGPPSSKIDVVELAGPRDLSPRDVAAAFGDVLGRDVALQPAPLDAVVPTYTSLGISPAFAEESRRMYEGIANGLVDWEGNGARFVRGTVEAKTVIAALAR
jgi:NAD(P)H dehydrogenase (quinone)